jgi:hypothetical protein
MDQGYKKMMRGVRFRKSFFAVLSVMILLLAAAPVIPAAESQETFDQEHFLLTKVLGEYVSNGLVNYRALQANQATLKQYLQELASIDPEAYKKWTRQQKLALWINAYNAFTIRGILDHYPIEHSWLADPLGDYPDNSIRQIRGIWDDMTWTVMGEKYTLNHMEHEIMRRELADTRIHFVLVCASKGCPYLENKAFEASDLDERLEQAGINYIYKSRKLRIDRKNKVVRLPQIFKWFDEDFEEGTQYKQLFKDRSSMEAGILSWVYRYANKEDRGFLENNALQIAYLYYDWALNELP